MNTVSKKQDSSNEYSQQETRQHKDVQEKRKEVNQ